MLEYKYFNYDKAHSFSAELKSVLEYAMKKKNVSVALLQADLKLSYPTARDIVALLTEAEILRSNKNGYTFYHDEISKTIAEDKRTQSYKRYKRRLEFTSDDSDKKHIFLKIDDYLTKVEMGVSDIEHADTDYLRYAIKESAPKIQLGIKEIAEILTDIKDLVRQYRNFTVEDVGTDMDANAKFLDEFLDVLQNDEARNTFRPLFYKLITNALRRNDDDEDLEIAQFVQERTEAIFEKGAFFKKTFESMSDIIFDIFKQIEPIFSTNEQKETPKKQDTITDLIPDFNDVFDDDDHCIAEENELARRLDEEDDDDNDDDEYDDFEHESDPYEDDDEDDEEDDEFETLNRLILSSDEEDEDQLAQHLTRGFINELAKLFKRIERKLNDAYGNTLQVLLKGNNTSEWNSIQAGYNDALAEVAKAGQYVKVLKKYQYDRIMRQVMECKEFFTQRVAPLGDVTPSPEFTDRTESLSKTKIATEYREFETYFDLLESIDEDMESIVKSPENNEYFDENGARLIYDYTMIVAASNVDSIVEKTKMVIKDFILKFDKIDPTYLKFFVFACVVAPVKKVLFTEYDKIKHETLIELYKELIDGKSDEELLTYINSIRNAQ